MGTVEIYRALIEVPSFAGIFSSDFLSVHPFPVLVRITVIINWIYTPSPGGTVSPSILTRVPRTAITWTRKNSYGRTGLTQFSTTDLHSVELQHSHPATFLQRSVWTVRVSLLTLNGERPWLSPVYPLFRGLWMLFELGGARQVALALPSSLVPTLALHLTNLCEHLASGES
jgi:hypothetical protein